MAKKDKDDKSQIRFGTLKKIANLIQAGSDDIYKSTYYSDPENKKQLNDLKSSIDTSIMKARLGGFCLLTMMSICG